jgi:hypothetical protein
MGNEQKVEKRKEIVVENISDVALNKEDAARIIITESKDGVTTILAKTQGSVSITYLAGLLEVAKNDILNQKNHQQREEAPLEMIEVTLDETDFLMDHQGTLTAQGKVVGDLMKMPKPIVEMRAMAKQQFLNGQIPEA